MDISGSSAVLLRAPEQGAVDIEAINALERAEHRRQEQLCVPLVPANTYWYLTASPQLMAIVTDRMTAQQHRRRS